MVLKKQMEGRKSIKTQNDEPIEVIQDKNKEDNDDEYGNCFTEGCHKRGPLNINKLKEEQSRLDCAYCGSIWCIKCGVEWHLGQTCQQYQDDDANFGIIYGQNQGQVQNMGNGNDIPYDKIMDGNFGDNEDEDDFQKMIIQNDWRTCPLCTSTIEKNDGCNRITCIACSTQFCWLCNEILDPDNYMESHYNHPQSICSYR